MSDIAAQLREKLRLATHALDAPPQAAPRQLAELDDLLPEEAPLRPAAVLVPIVLGGEGPRLLLTRRTAQLTHHAGQISFPGGRIESEDAGPLAAAIRETREEIGVPAEWIEPVGYLDPLVTITGFIVTPVVALLKPAPPLALDRNEVDEAFEVPLSFVLDERNREPHSREFRGRVRHYLVINYGPYEIWGATAAMIANLAHRLEAA